VPISAVTSAYYLGARNFNGTADGFCNRECRAATIGSGLTAGEVSSFNTAMVTFQTALGRNV